MRPRNGLWLPYLRFVILRNSGCCRLCGIAMSAPCSEKAKGPEPLGSSPFRWCEWGDLNPHEHTLTAT